jgi:hypothetical protein
VLTDTRFWIGIGVGVVAVMFVVPWVKGTMAARAASS